MSSTCRVVIGPTMRAGVGSRVKDGHRLHNKCLFHVTDRISSTLIQLLIHDKILLFIDFGCIERTIIKQDIYKSVDHLQTGL